MLGRLSGFQREAEEGAERMARLERDKEKLKKEKGEYRERWMAEVAGGGSDG